jgi:dTDP-4-amino-4,6-dideoxygalactose transaminase
MDVHQLAMFFSIENKNINTVGTKEMSIVPLFKVGMHPNISRLIEPTLSSGFVSQGPRVEEFESKLKERFKTPYVVTVNSATSGLTMALKLLNLNPESEIVLASPLTCFATNSAILANGLKLRWVDVDPKTCNIDLDDLKSKIDKTTKAVLFVHWAGNCVDLDRVCEIQKWTLQTYGHILHVIHDCAHAFGSVYKGVPLGGTMHENFISVFSFQAIKHLSTVDGGMIIVPNEEMYKRAKLLRWFGIDRERRYGKGDDRLELDIAESGYKWHMNDVSAAIGLANLQIVDDNLGKFRSNGEYYDRVLKNMNGIELLEQVPGTKSAYWVYTFKIAKGDKLNFLEFMKSKGIMVSQVHGRNDVHSCLAQFKTQLPQLDALEKVVISIPCGFWVDEATRDHIVSCVKEWCSFI